MDAVEAIRAEMPIEKTFFMRVQTHLSELTSVGQKTYAEWKRK